MVVSRERIIDYATPHTPSWAPPKERGESLFRTVGLALLLLGGLALLTVLGALCVFVVVNAILN